MSRMQAAPLTRIEPPDDALLSGVWSSCSPTARSPSREPDPLSGGADAALDRGGARAGGQRSTPAPWPRAGRTRALAAEILDSRRHRLTAEDCHQSVTFPA
jgi:hypothetical protein